jgi:hypothetical protein
MGSVGKARPDEAAANHRPCVGFPYRFGATGR